jgi:hypothetical protein
MMMTRSRAWFCGSGNARTSATSPGAATRPVLVLAAWDAESALVALILARRRQAPRRLAAA